MAGRTGPRARAAPPASRAAQPRESAPTSLAFGPPAGAEDARAAQSPRWRSTYGTVRSMILMSSQSDQFAP